MAEPKYAVGQRVAYALNLRIQGRVRATQSGFEKPAYRVAWDHQPQHVHWKWHSESQLAPAVGTASVFRKASDIPDVLFLEAIEACRHARLNSDGTPAYWANRWDVAAYLAGDYERIEGSPEDYPNVPEKVVLAKIRRLDRRGLIYGCGDGCRGDLHLRDAGFKLLREQVDAQYEARIAAIAREAKPGPTLAETMAVIKKAGNDAYARAAPAQRAIADAQHDMMLYGEATVSVVGGQIAYIAASRPFGGLYERVAGDLLRIGFGTPSLMAEAEAQRQRVLDAFGVPDVLRRKWAEIDQGSIRRVLPQPKPCRQVDGTWIHGRGSNGEHTCPKWARG
jgi:hypothetical protein